MTETLAHGYPSEITQGELPNEYQHDRVYMDFKEICIRVLWTKSSLSTGRVNSLTLEVAAGSRAWGLYQSGLVT